MLVRETPDFCFKLFEVLDAHFTGLECVPDSLTVMKMPASVRPRALLLFGNCSLLTGRQLVEQLLAFAAGVQSVTNFDNRPVYDRRIACRNRREGTPQRLFMRHPPEILRVHAGYLALAVALIGYDRELSLGLVHNLRALRQLRIGIDLSRKCGWDRL
jgi:hypothetical protein